MDWLRHEMKNAILFALFSSCVSCVADTETVNGYTWTYHINGDTVEIRGDYYIDTISPTPTGAVTIPSALGGKPVTCIQSFVFRGCSGLTSVTIPAVLKGAERLEGPWTEVPEDGGSPGTARPTMQFFKVVVELP